MSTMADWESEEAISALLVCARNQGLRDLFQLWLFYSVLEFPGAGFQGTNEALGRSEVSVKACPPIGEQHQAPGTGDVISGAS